MFSASVPFLSVVSRLRGVLPRSLFGRLMIGFVAISLPLMVGSGFWLHRQVFRLLDQEANQRLVTMARLLATRLGADPLPALANPIGTGIGAHSAFRRRFQALFNGETALAWIRNAYWLDLRHRESSFIASFSRAGPIPVSLRPPSIDDIEEMIFDQTHILDRGQPLFPDPFAYGVARRIKIVLYPVLDEDGLLESVIGLEADLQYLNLFAELKDSVWTMVALAAIASVLGASLLSGSLAKRMALVIAGLKRVEAGEDVVERDLHIAEMNEVYQGVRTLGRRLRVRDAQLREVHQRKLDELAFTGAAIAHEIRNPLSAIEIHVGLLKRRLAKLEQQDETIAEIGDQIDLMKRLVTSFLQYSRRVEPERRPLAVAAWLREFLAEYQTRHAPMSWSVELDENLSLHVDHAMWRQIWQNLLDNARQACSGDLVIRVRVEHSDDGVRLLCADNGGGVASEVREKLFSPFTTGHRGGHGIGLALCRKLVEAHQGMITLAETGPEGSCFVLELPEYREDP